MKHAVLFRLAALVIVLALLCGCAPAETPTETPETAAPTETTPATTLPPEEAVKPGYTDAAIWGDGFLAVGTGGRLDQIGLDGSVTTLTSGTEADLASVWTDGPLCVVSGANGTLLISGDGTGFVPVPAPAQTDLVGAAILGGALYVGTKDGHVYRTQDQGASWEDLLPRQPESLLALTVNDSHVIAISRQTDVFISEDGDDWLAQNFNELYEGLYPVYVFTGLVPAGSTFFVLGYHADNPNIPVLMYTEETEVWMEKALAQINGAYPDPDVMLRINDLAFSIDQILGAADGGQVLTIPDCMNCNQSRSLPGAGDLTAVAVTQDKVLVVGEDFFCQVIDAQELRQERIQAEQAQYDQQNGAIIVDVREQQELIDEGYIPGALHIPVGEIAERLPELVPDTGTELIFYCKAGVRAQSAMETAMELGYTRVYNLGGLSDWPYEVAHDATEDTP